jgi:hypothetical protein
MGPIAGAVMGPLMGLSGGVFHGHSV